MEARTVLVTGATGLIGKAIVPLLLQQGFSVRALTRAGSPWPFGAHENLERIVGNMQDIVTLSMACKDIEGIIHLAAAKNDERDSRAVNVLGAKNLADAAKGNAVQWIIHVSTQSVKLPKRGLYGRTKLEAEQVLQGSSVPVTTLRCSVIYGNSTEGIVGSIVQFSQLPVLPVIGSGRVRFRPMHRSDLAIGILRCIDLPETRGRTYDVGGPTVVTFDELTKDIVQAQGLHRRLFHIPITIALPLARLLSILPRSPITVSNVLGAAKDVPMDPEPFMQDTGIAGRRWETGLKELFPAKSVIPPDVREATAFLRYVLAASIQKRLPSPREVLLYLTALKAHDITVLIVPQPCIRFPFLLGGIDIFTRLKHPGCLFQKKILIACAVLECSPLTSEWLLPRDRSLPILFALAVGSALRIMGKMILSLLMLPAFPFLKRHGVL